MIDFTIVTAVTPDYWPRLIWALPTWVHKPQFADRPIVVFHSGFNNDDPRKLQFIKKLFPSWTFVNWRMPKYDSQRELMLSAFVLGIEQYVKTPYYVKLDCDCYFTDSQDVFTDEDLQYDIVGHKWGYTKPGWWIDKLQGKPIDENNIRVNHDRIASFCCLHKTEYVVNLAKQFNGRLPIPSHDTVVWFYTKNWKGINVKKLGVDNSTNWRNIREATCVAPSHDNPHFNKVLLDKVQLEITTDCNLKCHNCDRACGIAPSKEYMAISQIWKFVEESLAHRKRWDRIDILGGEPTLYPDLPQLWAILQIYKNRYPRTRIRFSTNGLQEFTVPDWVDVRNSAKKHRLQDDHTAYNSAPADNGEIEIKCCSVPWRCGLALTKHGYFLCGGGAAVARVFGLDIGIKHLALITPEKILEQINTLCKYCGHSRVPSRHIPKEQEISPSWQKAIETYKDKKLSEY